VDADKEGFLAALGMMEYFVKSSRDELQVVEASSGD
jgi:hypothetical protein